MVCSKEAESRMEMTMNEDTLEEVTDFKYLENITKGSKNEKEI